MRIDINAKYTQDILPIISRDRYFEVVSSGLDPMAEARKSPQFKRYCRQARRRIKIGGYLYSLGKWIEKKGIEIIR